MSQDNDSNTPAVNTPADVANLKWVGNHFSDMANFAACEDFLTNRCTSMEDACETLKLMSWHGMGIEAIATDDDVREHFECSETTPKLFGLAG